MNVGRKKSAGWHGITPELLALIVLAILAIAVILILIYYPQEPPVSVLHRILKSLFIASTLALIYTAGWMLVRWHLVAQPFRHSLLAEIDNLEAKLRIENGHHKGDPRLEPIITEANGLLEKAKFIAGNDSLQDKLIWSQGDEEAAIQYIDSANIMLVDLIPIDDAKIRLTTIEWELRDTKQQQATELAESIAADIDCLQEDELRAVLKEALRIQDDYNLNSVTAPLINWYNKTTWLIFVALLLTIILAAIGDPNLLLVGATGGFLSRLTRALKVEEIPGEYALYWTSLALSPLAGALMGWSGIVLIVALRSMGILGTTFDGISWSLSTASDLPLVLGIAFLFGFSERFFVRIAESVEEHVTNASARTSEASG